MTGQRPGRRGHGRSGTTVVVCWTDSEVRHDLDALARAAGKSPAAILREFAAGEEAGLLRRRADLKPGVIAYDATVPDDDE